MSKSMGNWPLEKGVLRVAAAEFYPSESHKKQLFQVDQSLVGQLDQRTDGTIKIF